MTKGKPWTIEEESTLRDLIETKTPIETIAAKLKRKPDAVYIKCLRLGLTKNTQPAQPTTPDSLLPKELPSIEEALIMLATALKTATTPGLDRTEVQRLQALASLAKTYKEIFADYVDYRGIEKKLLEMEATNNELLERLNQTRNPHPTH
jgi:hypothetical protein